MRRDDQSEAPQPGDPRIRKAIAELKAMILARYPDARFEVGRGSDPEYIYLTAVVDAEEEDVVAVIRDRSLEMDVEEDVPVLVTAVRPAEHAGAEGA